MTLIARMNSDILSNVDTLSRKNKLPATKGSLPIRIAEGMKWKRRQIIQRASATIRAPGPLSERAVSALRTVQLRVGAFLLLVGPYTTPTYS